MACRPLRVVSSGERCKAVRALHSGPARGPQGVHAGGRQTWWSSVTNVGPVRHRAIDSSELRLTTLTGKAAKWVSTGRTLWQQSAVHV